MDVEAEVIPPGDDVPPGYRKQPHGGMLKPFLPGNNANPTGMGGEYREVMRIAKENSPQAMMALVMTMQTTKDDRCRIVAAEAILNRAGMNPPKDKDKTRDRPRVDLSKLTSAEVDDLRKVFANVTARMEADAKVSSEDDGEAEAG